MSINQKLKDEIRAVALLAIYFGLWIGTFVLLKTLILDEYKIEYHGLSLALVGALVLAKVVLVLEYVSLGAWIRNRPALLDVVLRTALYTLGVFVVLLLEKSFEGRHEHGGFVPSLLSVFATAGGYHVWANVICISGALLIYNMLSVLRRYLGEEVLIRLLLKPLPDESIHAR